MKSSCSKPFCLVFPGQGSQYVGMLDNWRQNIIAKQLINQAEDALAYKLSEIIAKGPKAELDKTTHTQPAVLLANIIAYKNWERQTGFIPTILGGHSLGEYAALVVAEVLDFAQAIKLVKIRAELMQNSAKVPCSMVAVLADPQVLNPDQIEQICQTISQETNELVAIANYNGLGQTVISGTIKALELCIEKLKSAGAKRALFLPVSGAFHCKLMYEASLEFKEVLAKIEFKKPKIPLIQNAHLAIHEDPTLIKQDLVEQLYKPVLWTQTINLLFEKNIVSIIECGPGKVLSNINSRINPELKISSFHDLETIEKTKNFLLF